MIKIVSIFYAIFFSTASLADIVYLYPGDCITVHRKTVCAKYSPIIESKRYTCRLTNVASGPRVWSLVQILTMSDGSTKSSEIGRYPHFEKAKCMDEAITANKLQEATNGSR